MTGEIDDIVLDPAVVLRSVILFDTYLLQSVRLREVPRLVEQIGLDGTMALLRSGLIQIVPKVGGMGEGGRDRRYRSDRGRTVLPLGSYHFAYGTVPDWHEWVEKILGEMQVLLLDIDGLNRRRIKTIQEAVAKIIYDRPKLEGQDCSDAFVADLSNDVPVVRSAAAAVLTKWLGRSVAPEQVEFSLSEIEHADWRARSNFESRFGLDPVSAHKVGLDALMVVSALNERFEWMETHSAVSGFRVSELPLFDDKVAFLARELDPAIQRERFTRVLEIAGLPDIEGALAAGQVDIPKLVELVQTSECQGFREWLRTVDSQDDAEIKDQLTSLAEHLRSAVHGGVGKVVRFGVSAVTGLIPPVGLAVSALDTFVLEKLVGKPGPTTFLSKLYPSIFERPKR